MSEKVQVKQRSKKFSRKYGKVAVIDIIERDPFIPEELQNELREKLPKQKTITAQDLSRKYGIMVSAAKKLIDKLEEEKLINFVSGNSRIKIYKGAQL